MGVSAGERGGSSDVIVERAGPGTVALVLAESVLVLGRARAGSGTVAPIWYRRRGNWWKW